MTVIFELLLLGTLSGVLPAVSLEEEAAATGAIATTGVAGVGTDGEGGRTEKEEEEEEEGCPEEGGCTVGVEGSGSCVKEDKEKQKTDINTCNYTQVPLEVLTNHSYMYTNHSFMYMYTNHSYMYMYATHRTVDMYHRLT